jgi:ParB family transcriptional regulator, chromosome partitioning protein
MSHPTPPRRQLGRGLASLMADTKPLSAEGVAAGDTLLMLAPAAITPNPDQPRRSFDTAQLDDLARSLRETGMLQPLIVRPAAMAGQYQIVAGERRWRAAQLAEMPEIPVILRSYTDAETLQIAIIENVQRADLNPIEEALAYRDLVDRFGHSQEQVAAGLGKSRSHIANMMRLLTLPENVRDMVRDGRLSTGHARALIPDPAPAEAAAIILSRGLSVRDTENLVRYRSKTSDTPVPHSQPTENTSGWKAIETDATQKLGRRITFRELRRTGEIALTITCRNAADMHAVIAWLEQQPETDAD